MYSRVELASLKAHTCHVVIVQKWVYLFGLGGSLGASFRIESPTPCVRVFRDRYWWITAFPNDVCDLILVTVTSHMVDSGRFRPYVKVIQTRIISLSCVARS